MTGPIRKTTLAAAAGHPVQYEPYLPPDAVWVIDGVHCVGSRAYRALTGCDPTSAAATPPYLPWYAPGYVLPNPPLPSAPDPEPPTERAPPTTPESEPAQRSEWCCGGTCLRVNCEYHGPNFLKP